MELDYGVECPTLDKMCLDKRCQLKWQLRAACAAVHHSTARPAIESMSQPQIEAAAAATYVAAAKFEARLAERSLPPRTVPRQLS
mmetsp:Transcript_6215/g.17827  ORF Transcript_6215/g.17827 Transcript_6215/m.17827 type:complete len:85 (-) Transcript_6215:588-842(-)